MVHMVPKRREDISRLQSMFSCMREIEKNMDLLMSTTNDLDDMEDRKGIAYHIMRLQKVYGELNAHLEGLLEAYEDEGFEIVEN